MKRKFAVIVDGQVLVRTTVADTAGIEQRIIASMLSNPTIIETTNTEVGPGWIWDGTEFINPGVE